MAFPVQRVTPAGLPQVLAVTALSAFDEPPFFANRGITVVSTANEAFGAQVMRVTNLFELCVHATVM